jgi:tetratricopeptide (TPR) repeat protein
MPGPWKVRAGAAAAVLALALGLGHRRIPSIFSTEAPSNRQRIELWKGALELAKAKPFVGCGAGNFRAQYPPYRPESEAAAAMAGSVALIEAEDPHSTHLSVLAGLGAPGALAYLALLGAVAVAGWRRRDALSAAGLAGIAAWLAAGTFNTLREFSCFDAMFWLCAGMACRGAAPAARRPVALAAPCMLGGLLLLVPAFLAAVAEWHASAVTRTADPNERIAAMKKAIAAWPAHWRARYELAEVYRRGFEDGQDDPALVPSARDAYEASLGLRPHQLQALNYAAWMLILEGDPDRARRHLERAERIAPWYFLTQHHLALLDVSRSPAAARERLEKAIAMQDRHGPSHFFLGLVILMDGGAPEAALKPLRAARDRGVDVGLGLRRYRQGSEREPEFAEFFPGKK